MGLKDFLKSNDRIRRLGKKIKIYLEFINDAKDFSNHYMEVAESQGDHSYRLMLLIHNLEKGMCRDNARPFGKEKARTMLRFLKEGSPEQQQSFAYRLARSTLTAWKSFYEENHWELDEQTCADIDALDPSGLRAGYELLQAPIATIESGDFAKTVFSRRSVRDFEGRPLQQEDIDFALDCFVAAPTACNRQMCKVYQIENPKIRSLLNHTILGIGGFNTQTVTLFVITYDVSSLEFAGERNQGYVNVGLTAMNFANGLHARGIGSCFMQWSNNRTDDKTIRQNLGIPETERIGIILGAGYYKKATSIPCSTRRQRDEVFSKL